MHNLQDENGALEDRFLPVHEYVFLQYLDGMSKHDQKTFCINISISCQAQVRCGHQGAE